MSTINETAAGEMTDTTNTDTEGTLTDDAPVVTKAKRTRTSPRTKALDEVCVMIDSFVADLRKGEEENDEENSEKIEVALDLRGRVTTLAEDGAPKPTYNGRHYLGVTEEGTRVHFQSNMPPTARSHGRGSKSNYTSVLGPFRTQEGVDYRIANPGVECPKVF
jgi:hypothetical protein